MLACALPACSLSISAPAANRKRNQMPVCDSGKGLVAVDSLAAIAFGVGGLAALSEDQGTGAVALVGAALFTAAALHGSSNADKCREAMADYGREMMAVAPDVEVRRTPTRRRRLDPEPEATPDDPQPPRTARTPTPPAPEPVPAPEPAPDPGTKPAPTPEPGTAPEPPRGVRDWTQFWREVP